MLLFLANCSPMSLVPGGVAYTARCGQGNIRVNSSVYCMLGNVVGYKQCAFWAHWKTTLPVYMLGRRACVAVGLNRHCQALSGIVRYCDALSGIVRNEALQAINELQCIVLGAIWAPML